MWKYESPIGNLFIRFNSESRRYDLIIKGEICGSYPSAVAAADDVYTHSTGCWDWDKLMEKSLDTPTDIYEWTKI